MFSFEAGGTLQGIAGTASAITVTVSGVSVSAAGVEAPIGLLYQGQLPNAAGVLFTIPVGQSWIVKTINITNATGSSVAGVQLFQNGAAAANSLIGPITMSGHYTLTGSENGWAMTDAAGVLQISSSGGGGGTVTSVGLSMPAQFGVTGSPVTGSGTLTAAWINETANTVFAGPNTGTPAVPAFRSLVLADLPTLPYPSTGACTVASASSPTTVNLTTEGTFDWFYPNGTTTNPRLLGNSTSTNLLHAKVAGKSGGMIYNSFEWVNGGNNTCTIFTQNFANPSASSTGTDDLAAVALSSAIAGQGINTTGAGATGVGFRFAVPASTATRTLRVYMNVFSGTATLTATPSDGSFSPTTGTVVATAGANNEGFFTVTYNTAHDGERVVITVLLTTNLGSNPDIKFSCATLA